MADFNTLTIQNLFDSGNAAKMVLQTEITQLENNFKPGDDVQAFQTALAQIQSQNDELTAENIQLMSFVHNSGYLTVMGTPTATEQISVQIGANDPTNYVIQSMDTLQTIAQGLAGVVDNAAQGPTANALGALIQFSNLESISSVLITNSEHITVNAVINLTPENTVQNVFDYANAKMAYLESQQTLLIQAGGDPEVLQNNLAAISDAIAFLQSGQAKIQSFISIMNL